MPLENNLQTTLGKKLLINLKEVNASDAVEIKALALKDQAGIVEIKPVGTGQFEVTAFTLGPVELTVFKNDKPLGQKITFNVIEKYQNQNDFLPSFGPMHYYFEIFLFFLFLALLAALGWQWFKKHKKNVAQLGPSKTWQEYFNEWLTLQKTDDLAQKAHHSSVWLKQFMSEYLKKPSRHLTTPEMTIHQQFLNLCDEIKFSKNFDAAKDNALYEMTVASVTHWLHEVKS